MRAALRPGVRVARAEEHPGGDVAGDDGRPVLHLADLVEAPLLQAPEVGAIHARPQGGIGEESDGGIEVAGQHAHGEGERLAIAAGTERAAESGDGFREFGAAAVTCPFLRHAGEQ